MSVTAAAKRKRIRKDAAIGSSQSARPILDGLRSDAENGKPTPAAGAASVGLFDPAKPWPIGSVIVVEAADGAGGETFTLETFMPGPPAGLELRRARGTYMILTVKDWNAEWASAVQEVCYPETPLAGCPVAPTAELPDAGETPATRKGETPSPRTGPRPAGNPQSEIRNPKSPGPPKADLVMVPVADVDASHNIRTSVDEPALLQLGESIRDLGQLQPVVVHLVGDTLRLVAGGRRLEAARRSGAKYIEAKVYKDVPEKWEVLARLAENFQRADLNHIELAHVFGEAAEGGMTVAEIARDRHVSDDQVRRHLALLRLAPEVQQIVATGRLPIHQAELIARVGDPQAQLDLAEAVVDMEWKPATGKGPGAWVHKKEWGEKPGDPQDHVKAMDQLRKDVAWRLCGLAAAGWLKEEEASGQEFTIDGRARCLGCPDNTQTYADQPTLFAGIRPQGSGKKGYCTNKPCWAKKAAAWEKVIAARKREQEKATAAQVKQARKAGLAVCEVEGCGKVADAGEKFPACKELGGLKACPACAKKAKGRAGRSGGGDSYDAKRTAAAAKAKRFPETPQEKLAVALWKHLEFVQEAIALHLEGFKDIPETLAHAVLVAAVIRGVTVDIKKAALPELVQTAAGKARVSGPCAAAIWREATKQNSWNGPGVQEHDGKVHNVPLPKEIMAEIDEAEAIAAAWKVEIPARPTLLHEDASQGLPCKASATQGKAPASPVGGKDSPADVRANAVRNAIVQGNKRQALAAIDACTSAADLEACEAAGLKGDWRRAAVKRKIDKLADEGDGADGEADE